MILVTGGAGYIGSHTCIELLNADEEVVILDNLCNSSRDVIGKIERITGQRPIFIEGDIRDETLIGSIFHHHPIHTVIHFAGLKAVAESVSHPLTYYENNVEGSLALFRTMTKYGVKNLVFSSSATVYGDPRTLPSQEDFPLNPTNPYGRTKLMIEEILQDMARSDDAWHISILRYFNPVGAHESGLIGEFPTETPNNLMPYIAQVAVGEQPFLSIFGDDYPTPDGTGVRDFIHVVDLAVGHLKALRHLAESAGAHIYNLGSGKGHSVLELVREFEYASGIRIPFKICPRRPGDVASSYADPTKAERELGWKSERPLSRICSDTWRWVSAKGVA